MKDFPLRLKRWRACTGLTQQKLADILGVTSGAVAQWENSEYDTLPAAGKLEAIAKAFGVPLGHFLSFIPPEQHTEGR